MKNSPSILFCIDKETKEDYDSDVRTVHSGLGGEVSVPRRDRGNLAKEKFEKDFVSRWSSECVLASQ